MFQFIIVSKIKWQTVFFSNVINHLWPLSLSVCLSDIYLWQLILTFPLNIWIPEGDSHRSQYLLVSFLKLHINSVTWCQYGFLCLWVFFFNTVIKFMPKFGHICWTITFVLKQTTKIAVLSHHPGLITANHSNHL